MGLHAELSASSPWTSTGAVCRGGPRPHCQERLCGTVHATLHQSPHRCSYKFVLNLLQTSTAGSFNDPYCHIFSSGYRHVHLLKADGSSLSPATLFVHVKVKRRGVPVKTVSERIAQAKGKAWHAFRKLSVRRGKRGETDAPAAASWWPVSQSVPVVVQFTQSHVPVQEEPCWSEMRRSAVLQEVKCLKQDNYSIFTLREDLVSANPSGHWPLMIMVQETQW